MPSTIDTLTSLLEQSKASAEFARQQLAAAQADVETKRAAVTEAEHMTATYQQAIEAVAKTQPDQTSDNPEAGDGTSEPHTSEANTTGQAVNQ